ncbi:MAG: hypothetical protein ACRD8Z_14565 [Nitrososphaeraceae archaeon]
MNTDNRRGNRKSVPKKFMLSFYILARWCALLDKSIFVGFVVGVLAIAMIGSTVATSDVLASSNETTLARSSEGQRNNDTQSTILQAIPIGPQPYTCTSEDDTCECDTLADCDRMRLKVCVAQTFDPETNTCTWNQAESALGFSN